MQMKKRISITLIILILFSFLSVSLFGCGGANNKEENALTLFVNNGNKFDGAAKDSIWKHIEEETDTTLYFIGASHASSYYTKLNPLMNTITNMPDVVFLVPSSEEMGKTTFSVKWTDPEIGLLYSFEELMGRYPAGTYPYLEKIFSSSQYGNMKHHDNHYILPMVTTKNSWGIYYRTDWLVNVGYYQKDEQGNPILDQNGDKIPRFPQNIVEFSEVLKLFTTADPDQDGKHNTYGWAPGSGEHCWNVLYHAFGVTPDWDIDDEGNIDYMYTSEKFRNFLAWASAMYSQGYIFPTYSSLPANGERDKFYDGTCGILITNAESHVSFIMDKMTKLGKGQSVQFGPAIEGVGEFTINGQTFYSEEGSKGFSDWGGWWGGYCITKACKNIKGALKLFDYMLSPEGSMLRLHGKEGVHYTIDENGEIVPNIQARAAEGGGKFEEFTVGGVSAPLGRYVLGTIFGSSIDWEKVEESGVWDVKISAKIIDPANEVLVQQALDNMVLKSSKLVNFTDYSASVITQMVDVEDVSSAFVNNAIIGKKNLTSDWNAMISEIKGAKWTVLTNAMKSSLKNAGVID
jgi:hypothetical protein